MVASIGHFIDNKLVAGKSGRTGDITNPATGELTAKVAFASVEEIDAAVQTAKKAQLAWAATPPLRRQRVMFNLKGLIEKRIDDLARHLSLEHGKTFDDAKGEIGATDWDGAKEAYADRVLALLETYAPGLGAKILGRSVFSPLDLERENPNLIGGDNLSGSHHLSQNFLFRPARGFANWSTPVAGLHLVGAATWPGGGTGAGSGYMLAQKLGGG